MGFRSFFLSKMIFCQCRLFCCLIFVYLIFYFVIFPRGQKRPCLVTLLFQSCKLGLVNIDDPACETILKDHTCELETFGFSNPQAQLKGSNEGLIYRPGYLGAHFDVSGAMKLSVDVDIPGKFSAYNAIAAIAATSTTPGKTLLFLTMPEIP